MVAHNIRRSFPTWKSFGQVVKSQHPVQYFDQPNAWMSGEIFHEVLAKTNHHLLGKSQSVGLFLYNALCHPPDIEGQYRNIKVRWLPVNTTSKLQPLDLGIMKNF